MEWLDCRMDDRIFGFDSRQEQEIFIFPLAYMELIQLSVHRVPRFLSPGPRHWGVNLCLHSIIHFHWLGAWLSTQRTSPEGYGQPYFLVCFCARATTCVPPCIGTGVRIVLSALRPPPLPQRMDAYCSGIIQVKQCVGSGVRTALCSFSVSAL